MTWKWTVIALFCFALPWVAIKKENDKDAYGRVEEYGLIRLSQSGHQMAYGGHSRTVTPPTGVAAHAEQSSNLPDEYSPSPCPLVVLYGVALIAALGLSLHRSFVRQPKPAIFAIGIAVVCLLLQSLFGMPLWGGGHDLRSTLIPSFVLEWFHFPWNYCAFTAWYWMSWIALIGAFVSANSRRVELALPNQPRPLPEEET